MITNRFRNARNTEHTPTFGSKRGTVAANCVPRKTKPSITMAIPERRLGWKRCLYRYNFLSIFGWFIWYVVRNTTLPKEILQSVQFVLLNSQTQRIPETRRIISLPLFARKDKFMIHVTQQLFFRVATILWRKILNTSDFFRHSITFPQLWVHG